MPSDALTYFHLSRELDSRLSGGRIERVSMPSQNSVIFFVKPKGEKKSVALLLSAEPARSRVYITADKGENPLSAYAFLMHLRKRVSGGTITSITTLPHERIIKFDVSAYDELGYSRDFTLYAEMMGRYSNLVLVGSDGKITDALKRISLDEGQTRAFARARLRRASRTRRKMLADDEKSVVAVLDSFDGGSLANHAMDGIFGYAPITMREIVFRAYGTLAPDPETVKARKDLFLRELTDCQTRFEPCVNERQSDFFAYPYLHTNEKYFPAGSLSEAMETVFSRVIENGYERGKAAELITHIKSAIKKNERSEQILRQRLLDSVDYENDRVLGELITANMYRLRGGEKEIEVDDYYTGEKRTIPLDPLSRRKKRAKVL
ncbi:MAG: NFACT family protein [Christensenellales bacterium]